MMKEYITQSPAETEELGRRIGESLHSGQVIAMTGDLAAGKTTLLRGLAKGMGLSDDVTSPTFAIVHEYREGPLPLFHFDMYRLNSSEDLFDIGWEDYLREGGVCAVEWSENVADAMPADALRIDMQVISEASRHITITEG